MAHPRLQVCSYSTVRLDVGPWHDLADRYGIDLVETVQCVLTERTTAWLPDDWRGDFDVGRAQRWIDDRDGESPTLLVVSRDGNEPIGFVVLFGTETDGRSGSIDIRLGYVLAEAAWGRGLARELVGGFVDWARAQPSIATITAGVTDSNLASAAVLLRNGFAATGSHHDEQLYRHTLD